MYRHIIEARSLSLLNHHVGKERVATAEEAVSLLAKCLRGRRLVAITGDDRRKGGVYEIVRSLMPYFLDAGIDVAWIDLDTDPAVRPTLEFFHVLAHGQPPSNNWRTEIAYHSSNVKRFGEESADQVARFLVEGDLLFTNDTQTAETAGALSELGWPTLWHSHIGTKTENDLSEAYWSVFTEPLKNVGACIFYFDDYVPKALRHISSLSVPGVDPSLTKNTPMTLGEARRRLAFDAPLRSLVTEVSGELRLVGPAAIVATQVSRWDVLKDMSGVMAAFALAARSNPVFHGIVAGTVAQSANEELQLAKCLQIVKDAPPADRRRLHILTVESSGSDAHDEVIRILQSASDVVLQKSLREGFGLTVTEAMLKGKAIVASQVGGISTQIVDRVSGILMEDPTDIELCARSLVTLTSDARLRHRLGANARRRALQHFGIDSQIRRIARVLTALAEGSDRPQPKETAL